MTSNDSIELQIKTALLGLLVQVSGADPEGVVWGGGGGTHTGGGGGTVMLGLFLVFVKPILLEV